MDNHARVRQFIGDFTRLIERHANDEPAIFDQGGKLLAALVSEDDWLPVAYSMPDADRYQQYLLYCDPLERFSVMSFVWGPGQKTPVHDHTVWGIIGVLRGMEICHEYEVTSGSAKAVASHELRRGEIDRVSPSVGRRPQSRECVCRPDLYQHSCLRRKHRLGEPPPVRRSIGTDDAVRIGIFRSVHAKLLGPVRRSACNVNGLTLAAAVWKTSCCATMTVISPG